MRGNIIGLEGLKKDRVLGTHWQRCSLCLNRDYEDKGLKGVLSYGLLIFLSFSFAELRCTRNFKRVYMGLRARIPLVFIVGVKSRRGRLAARWHRYGVVRNWRNASFGVLLVGSELRAWDREVDGYMFWS